MKNTNSRSPLDPQTTFFAYLATLVRLSGRLLWYPLVKYMNQNSASNKLNEKNNMQVNLKTFYGLIDFSDFYGKLEVVKVINVHPEVTVFRGPFYL